MIYVIAVFLLAVSWIAYKMNKIHGDEAVRKIPGPRGYPIIGNLLVIRNVTNVDDLLDMFKDVGAKFDGIFKLWLGPLLHVVVHHPKYIQALAHSPNSAYKGPIYNIIFGDAFDGFFLTDDISKWKVLRKPFLKLLSKNILMRDHYKIFVNKSINLVELIREKRLGKEVNVIDDVSLFSFDIILETHSGISSDELRNPRFYFIKNVNRFLEYLIPNALKIYFVKKMGLKPKLPEIAIEAKRNFRECFNWLFEESSRRGKQEGNETFEESNRRGKHKGGLEYYSDFLLRRQKEKGISEDIIHSEIGDSLVAGSDTTGIVISSVITFLAMHPEVQELAYKEQSDIFGSDKTREPSHEELSSMQYLTRVIKESLRFASPPIIFKHTRGDVNIGEYTIPKGTEIEIFIRKLHQDPKYWEQPTSFYPDHFLPEKEAARHKYAYIPFGFGPRICPGVLYGMVLMKIVLSFILRNFTVTTDLKFENIIYKFKLLTALHCGYMVTYSERSKNI